MQNDGKDYYILEATSGFLARNLMGGMVIRRERLWNFIERAVESGLPIRIETLPSGRRNDGPAFLLTWASLRLYEVRLKPLRGASYGPWDSIGVVFGDGVSTTVRDD